MLYTWKGNPSAVYAPYLWTVPDMTYNVFGGTLSLTQSINPNLWNSLPTTLRHLTMTQFCRRLKTHLFR